MTVLETIIGKLEYQVLCYLWDEGAHSGSTRAIRDIYGSVDDLCSRTKLHRCLLVMVTKGWLEMDVIDGRGGKGKKRFWAAMSRKELVTKITNEHLEMLVEMATEESVIA